MSDLRAFLDDGLNDRIKNHRLRSLSMMQPAGDGVTIEKNGQHFLNFSANDYMGLAADAEVRRKAAFYLENYGSGATASRLISGTFDIHTQLENDLASAFNREAALIFNSGFQANSTILGTVTDRHSLILADKLSHNSLLQGSLFSRAKLQRFQHNDTSHLANLLKKAQANDYNRIWIVTESVFSMDGDRSPLPEIEALARRYDALLFVDEAHAVGVWGKNGLGLAQNIDTDILLGTCGKSFGSFGAYAAGSKKIHDYLLNFCPGFIYTTALPPVVIGATQAALERLPRMNEKRTAYHQKIEYFRKSVQNLGFDTGPSTTQIIPLIMGDDEETLKLSHHLEKKKILATAIRPPTVPKNSARIRLTISSAHTKEHLDELLAALKSWNHAQN